MEEYTGISATPSKNPYYHSAGDTVSTLNLKLHAESTRAILATVAVLASR